MVVWHTKRKKEAVVSRAEIRSLRKERYEELVGRRAEFETILGGIVNDGVAKGVFATGDVALIVIAVLNMLVEHRGLVQTGWSVERRSSRRRVYGTRAQSARPGNRGVSAPSPFGRPRRREPTRGGKRKGGPKRSKMRRHPTRAVGLTLPSNSRVVDAWRSFVACLALVERDASLGKGRCVVRAALRPNETQLAVARRRSRAISTQRVFNGQWRAAAIGATASTSVRAVAFVCGLGSVIVARGKLTFVIFAKRS